jgi:hypothetical protein
MHQRRRQHLARCSEYEGNHCRCSLFAHWSWRFPATAAANVDAFSSSSSHDPFVNSPIQHHLHDIIQGAWTILSVQSTHVWRDGALRFWHAQKKWCPWECWMRRFHPIDECCGGRLLVRAIHVKSVSPASPFMNEWNYGNLTITVLFEYLWKSTFLLKRCRSIEQDHSGWNLVVRNIKSESCCVYKERMDVVMRAPLECRQMTSNRSFILFEVGL